MTLEQVAKESLELRSSVGGSRGERQGAGSPQMKAIREPPTDVPQTAGFTRTLENGRRTARRWCPPWSPRATIPADIHADAFASVLGHFQRFPLLTAVAEGKPGFNPAAALAYFTPVDGGASSLSHTHAIMNILIRRRVVTGQDLAGRIPRGAAGGANPASGRGSAVIIMRGMFS